MAYRIAQDFDQHEQQKQRDQACGHRFVFPVTVGMIRVGRPSGRPDAYEPDHVRRGVRERVETVGKYADGAAQIAEEDLGNRNGQVEEENANEDPGDLPITRAGPKLPATRVGGNH
jgi:hypothetical protein